MDANPNTTIRWFLLPRTDDKGKSYYPPKSGELARFLVSLVAMPLQATSQDVNDDSWLRDWPSTIVALEPALFVRVTLRSGPSPLLPSPHFIWDPEEWKRSFRQVYPGDFSRSMWLDLFGKTTTRAPRAASRPLALPEVPHLAGLGEHAAAFAQRVRFEGARAAGRAGPPAPSAEDLLRQNVAKLAQQRPPASTKEELAAALDFNQVISKLTHYPRVAREVGLICDGYFDLDTRKPADVDSICLELDKQRLPDSLKQPVNHVFANVACDWQKSPIFAAAIDTESPNPTTPPTFGRMNDQRHMDLDPPLPGQLPDGFTHVTPVDPVASAYQDEPSQTEQLLVLNANLWQRLAWRAKRSADLRAQASPTVYAQDLVRGFAVDLDYDRTTGDRSRKAKWADDWRSLCRREARYRVVRSANSAWKSASRTNTKSLPSNGTVADEGWVQLSALGMSGFDTNFVSDAAFRLDGWSLICPRPFGPSDADPTPDRARIIELETNRPPKKDMWPLQFGRRYRCRARFIDLAGNDMSRPFPRAPYDFLEFTHLRVEPVAAPVVGWEKAPKVRAKKDAFETERRVVVGMVDAKGKIHVGNAVRRVAAPPASFQICNRAQDLSRETAELLADRDGLAAQDENGVVPGMDPRHIVDPWSSGVMLEGVGGGVEAEWYGSWPDCDAVTLDVKLGALPDPRKLDEQLDLAERGDGPSRWEKWILSDAQASAEKHAILVTVPPASTVSLRLRSTIPQKLLSDFYRGDADEIPPEQVAKTKTQVCDLEIVAPVAFPLMKPRIVGALSWPETEVPRLPEQSFSDLKLQSVIHAPSTGELKVLAAWTDPNSSGPGPGVEHKEVIVAVQRVPDRGPQAPNAPPGAIQLPIDVRHHHADTRYRRIHYSLEGVTRFASHFSEVKNEPSSKAVMVHVLSSHPPAVPAVEMIVPILRQTSRVVPNGQDVFGLAGFRVFLGREWYSSGDNERLAVVTSADRGSALQSVTRWGADPIRLHPKQDGVISAGAPDVKTEPFDIERGAEKGVRVNVLPLPVRWDADRGWYADLNVNVSHVDMAFVQLALARWQLRSIKGCKLSDVVRPDFIQIPAQRKLFLRRDGAKLTVRVQRLMTPPRPTGNLQCAVFDEDWTVTALPRSEEEFKTLMRGARDKSETPDPQDQEAQRFVFSKARVGQQLVVWEEGGGAADSTPNVPLRAIVVRLEI
jgi:hypothetical protein